MVSVFLFCLSVHLLFALVLRSGVNILHFVLLCVFMFLIPYCDVSYDFNIKTMYGTSFSPSVCRRALVLFIVICVCLRIVVSRGHHGRDCMVVGFYMCNWCLSPLKL